MKKYHYCFGVVGTLVLGSIPIYFIGKPSILFPLPIYLVLSGIAGLQILICLLVFFLTSLLVFDKSPEIFKKRTFIINSLLTIGSIAWLLIARKHGIQYQGVTHYISVVILNALGLLSLWWLSFKSTSKKSFAYSLMLPFFLVWLAFPYLGELV